MEWNVVRLTAFATKGTPLGRLDAEYVSPHLLGPEASTRRYSGKPLGEVTSAYKGPTVNPSLKGEYELVDYISIDAIDIQDGLTYTSAMLYKDRPLRAKYVVRTGDILVANVRPNRGAVAIVTERTHGALASSGFTLCRGRPNSELKQEFLFAFLKTEFARNQLVRRGRGSMYPAVLPDDVVDVWVPLPPMTLHDRVVDCVKEGLRLHARFFELYSRQANALEAFLKKVGSPPPSPLEESPEQVLWSIRRCSEFFGEHSANRFDAEFFRNDYERFEQRLMKATDSFVLGQFYKAASGRTQGKPVAEIA